MIRSLVDDLTRTWLEGDPAELGARLGPLFHERAVICPPSPDDPPAVGREACVQSYRDYTDVARTISFESGAVQVHVWNNTAVATYPFSIAYEMNGREHHETGRETLVLDHDRNVGRWLIVWRRVDSIDTQ